MSYCIGSSPVITEGLIAYYDIANPRCWEGSGNIIKDLSGNGYHASAVDTFSVRSSYISFDGPVNTYGGKIAFPNEIRLTGNQTIVLWWRVPQVEDWGSHSTILGGISFAALTDCGVSLGYDPGKLITSDIYSGDPYGNHLSTCSTNNVYAEDTHIFKMTCIGYEADTNLHITKTNTNPIRLNIPIFLTYQVDWGSTPFQFGKSCGGGIAFAAMMVYDRLLSEEEMDYIYNSNKYRYENI